MKIGIEAQRIFRADKHGMDYVVLEVLRVLQKIAGNGNEYVVFAASGPDVCLHSTPGMEVVVVSCPGYPLWEQWALPRAVSRHGVDMLHCTSNTAPLRCPVPLVLTLHDIIYLDDGATGKGMSAYQRLGRIYRRWNVPRIVERCRRVITVSQTERGNILRRFPRLDGRLDVVHNGYSDRYRPLPPAQVRTVTRKYLPDERYLLFLGNTDPRKNTVGVLQAYNEYLNRAVSPLPLVVTGLKKECVEQMLVNLGIEICAPNVFCTGYVPGDDLPALYNGAAVFLCPSLKEGFGIPVLESMACGTPVVTSNCSSLPEVAGEGALLVDPHNPSEIADAVIRLTTDGNLRKEQVAYGLQRVKSFSWEHTAEEYAKRYEAVLKGGK